MSNEEVKPEVVELKIKKKYIITPEKRKQYYETFKAKHPKPVKDCENISRNSFNITKHCENENSPSNEEVELKMVKVLSSHGEKELSLKKKYIITPEKQKQYQDTYKAKHPKPVKDTVAKKPYNEKEYKREYMQAHREKYKVYYRNYQRRVHADAKELAKLKKVLVPFVMA
jgi:hypothetical protein